MVFKRIATAKRRKPTFRRRKRFFKKRAKATTSIVRAPSAFADKTICKLNYVDLLTDNGSAFSVISFRGNSLFGPLYPTGGHQPMGFDQYMAIYNKFTCVASSIKIRWTTNSTAPFSITIRPTNSNAAVGYQFEALERPRTVMSQQAGYECRNMKHYATTSRVTGEKRGAIMSEDNFSGDASTNPNNVWYWQIGLNRDSGLTIAAYLWVKITYYVVFHDRKPMVLS